MPYSLQEHPREARQLTLQVSRAASRADRERARVAILREASIVGSTLSFSGSSALAALGNHFDVVIIDEAAQAVEPSTLIPLVAGCKQVRAGSAGAKGVATSESRDVWISGLGVPTLKW